MNQKETAMMEAIKANSTPLADLKETTEGRYSRYDCRNDKFVVELKYRKGQQYEDTMIEQDKYKALTYYEAFGVAALYAVHSADNLYIFNLSKLTQQGYDFGWHIKGCNKTTEFHNQQGNGKKVPKTVGMIDWDKADKVIPIEI